MNLKFLLQCYYVVAVEKLPAIEARDFYKFQKQNAHAIQENCRY